MLDVLEVTHVSTSADHGMGADSVKTLDILESRK